MINSRTSPRTQRWFDLIGIGAGFIVLLVLMLLLVPVFSPTSHSPLFPKTVIKR